MSTSPIGNVSDTARWVAVYRAMESERPDALFHDPYARRLAGSHGETIVSSLPKGMQMAWPMIIRTAVMDEIIMRLVKAGSVNTVLNLAAGLDARPWRLDLPGDFRWFEADLPAMSAYKQEQMAADPPRCQLELIAADLRNADERAGVFARAAVPGASVLVVTEGLLVYLTREAVGDLARDLGARPAMRFWLMDLGSPRLQKFMQRSWGRHVTNSPFQFFPPEGSAFFEPFGWRESEFRSMWDESFRLNRTMRFAGLWKFLSHLSSKKSYEAGRRMSGMVLLDRPA